ncbi:MAG: NADH-quinone oxidoreductase subunit J [Limisphaerales bacterium]
MTPVFLILALVTLLSAAAAMSLRNLVHCALSLVVTFAGLAALFLQLHAQFVGFAQVLVYIGAVAILIVFAILLTRSGDTPNQAVLAPGWIAGIIISALVFTALGWAVLNSNAIAKETPAAPDVTVKNIGDALMSKYVLPLEVMGLLLTAAMIGAVIIAMRDEVPGTKMADRESKMAEPSAPSSILHPPTSGRKA